MTREELTAHLTSILTEFARDRDPNREYDTSVLLKLTFRDVGDLVGADDDMWWDENLLMFIPEEPQ
jgi:hypothetical protein